MVNNFEKFRLINTYKRKSLEEGLEDYYDIDYEEKEKKINELDKETNEVIESFYDENGRRDDLGQFLKSILDSKSKTFENFLFSKWLSQNSEDVFFYIYNFKRLDNSKQDEIYEYLSNEENYYPFLYDILERILCSFDKIYNKNLEDFIVLNCSSFTTLIKYREKLPHITDEILLDKLNINSGNYHQWYDWCTLVSYIDKFPQLDKQEVLRGAFNQSVNRSLENIIKNMDKLGLSQRETIDLFIQEKNEYELCKSIEFIDEQFHSEIVEKNIESGDFWAILQNSKKIKNVDKSSVLSKIFSSSKTDVDVHKGLKIIINHIYYLSEDWLRAFDKKMIDEMIEKYPGLVASKYVFFSDNVDRDRLKANLLENKDYSNIISLHKELDVKLDESFVINIIDYTNQVNLVVDNIIKFDKLSREIYFRLFEINAGDSFLVITEFEGITKEDVFYCLGQGVTFLDSSIQKVIDNFEKIGGLELDDSFIDILLSQGYYNVVEQNIKKFDISDQKKIVTFFIDVKRVEFVLKNLEIFSEVDINYIIDRSITIGCGIELIQLGSDKIDLNSKDIIQKFIDSGDTNSIIFYLSKFSCLKEDREMGSKILYSLLEIEDWNLGFIDKINNFYQPVLEPMFNFAYDILGELLTRASYKLIANIKENKLGKNEMKKLGITRGGDVGINQFKEKINVLKSKILEEDFDVDLLDEFDFYKQYFKAYVRFEESEWGGHEEEGFDLIVEKYRSLLKNGEFRQLQSGYEESGTILIDKVNKEAQEDYQYTEQFFSRFVVLKDGLAKALALMSDSKPYSKIISSAEQKIMNILQNLDIEIEELNNPEKLEQKVNNLQQQLSEATEDITKRSLEKQIKDLQNVKRLDFKIKSLEAKKESLLGLELRSVKDFQSNFIRLSGFSEFYVELMQLIFYYALHHHKDFRARAEKISHDDKPKFDDISWLINFVEHIVNEETWSEYFTNEKAKKEFLKIVNLNAIKEEFSRAQNQETRDSLKMDFIPTRGLLMEFSGHIADACWASKYNSISEDFNNFTSVTMVQNRGTRYERLVGSCMLIETLAKDGTPLLVIRGLNPIENVINSVKVNDFFDKFIEYIEKISENRGRKLAIVIDDNSGGSASNRPILYDYLDSKRKVLNKVVLASEEDTTFNGYNIVNNTYLV